MLRMYISNNVIYPICLVFTALGTKGITNLNLVFVNRKMGDLKMLNH